METRQDTKNKRVAFLLSVGLHASLFLTFFFLISWRAPYPPAPEYGVVLNFGLDNQGGGDIQPETPVGNAQVDDKNTEPQPNEKKAQEEPTKITDQQEEVKEEKTDAALSDENSEVTVKAETKKIEDKPKDKVEKVEPKKEVKAKTEEKQVVKNEAVYPGNVGAKKGETNQSQGDDPGKVGDKGNPQGKLDAKALYGKPGGGGGGDGFGLDMSGWQWASQPKIPDLPDNEDGRIVFDIECDEDGEIISIATLERGLSAKAEQLLKDVIRKNSLIRTSNGKAPAKSKGQVVFVLKTK
jgi:outer membrane biosynthesis protein TonB